MERKISMKKAFYSSIFLFLVSLIVLNSNVLAHTDVTPLEAKELIEDVDQLIIVDVREVDEYCDEEGHIPGAVNYPWNSGVLETRYEELPLDSPILVVCRSGNRSNPAAEFLDSKGYQNVYDMEGGMIAWEWETEGCVNSDSDGDGIVDEMDNCPEIHNPDQEDNDENGLGDVCDPNTTTCPVEAIYGDQSEETQFLRDYRDHVLRKSPEGRTIIRLYYKLGPAIVVAIENNKKLRNELEAQINKFLLYVPFI